MSLSNLKNEIEATLLIKKWSPTEYELHEISEGIRSCGNEISKRELHEIVRGVIGPFEHAIMEGQDNSDLTTILMMATKVENK